MDTFIWCYFGIGAHTGLGHVLNAERVCYVERQRGYDLLEVARGQLQVRVQLDQVGERGDALY